MLTLCKEPARLTNGILQKVNEHLFARSSVGEPGVCVLGGKLDKCAFLPSHFWH